MGTVASLIVAACGSPLSSARLSRLTALVASSEEASAHPALLPRATSAAAATLIVCWLLAVRAAARGDLAEPGVWRVFAAWALPLVVGAPLLSADVYAYVADARLLAHGHDPYAVGPAALGHDPVISAVGPQWRTAPTPYGPVALLLLRPLAALGVGAAATLLALAAATAVVGTGLLLRRLVDAQRRPFTLALWLLSPPVLLHLVGGAHLDAVMLVLLVAAFAVSARGHPLAAVALAALAAGVKAPAVLGVAALVLTGLPARPRAKLEAMALRLVVAAGAYAAPALLLPDPLGLRHGLSAPGTARTLGAPVTLAWRGLGAAQRAVSWLPVPSLGLLRLVALILTATVAAWLLATHARRPPLRTTGLALFVTAALAPAFYPWYAGWPLACLAPTVRPRRRRVAVVLVILGSLPGLPGLDRLGAMGAALAVTAVLAVLVVAWRSTRDEGPPAPR